MFAVSSSFSVSETNAMRNFSRHNATDGQPRRQLCCKMQLQQDRIQKPGSYLDLHSKANNLQM